jgi:hypothetical protein
MNKGPDGVETFYAISLVVLQRSGSFFNNKEEFKGTGE